MITESQVLGSPETSHDKVYFFCGSSILNEIERVAVQGLGLVNILAYGHLIFHDG